MLSLNYITKKLNLIVCCKNRFLIVACDGLVITFSQSWDFMINHQFASRHTCLFTI